MSEILRNSIFTESFFPSLFYRVFFTKSFLLRVFFTESFLPSLLLTSGNTSVNMGLSKPVRNRLCLQGCLRYGVFFTESFLLSLFYRVFFLQPLEMSDLRKISFQTSGNTSVNMGLSKPVRNRLCLQGCLRYTEMKWLSEIK